jgi:hypothetical protein
MPLGLEHASSQFPRIEHASSQFPEIEHASSRFPEIEHASSQSPKIEKSSIKHTRTYLKHIMLTHMHDLAGGPFNKAPESKRLFKSFRELTKLTGKEIKATR